MFLVAWIANREYQEMYVEVKNTRVHRNYSVFLWVWYPRGGPYLCV